MGKILITGGAGFIGSNLALALIGKGHQVRVLDSLSPQIHGTNPQLSPLFCSIGNEVDFVRGDVTVRSDILKALDGIDTVIHLAAETGTGQSMYAIKHYTDVNVGGTALMLDIIANEKTSVRKIVVASSRAVYGEGKYNCAEHGNVFPEARSVEVMEKGDFDLHCPHCGKICEMVPTDELSPVRPSSIYGITKLNQEQMVLVAGNSLGIPSVALRYQNVFGPGQSLSNPYTGILSIFSTRIRNGNAINVFEDGKESRDFVYIDDVVAATVSAAEADEKTTGVYNVGSGTATDVLTVVRLLGEHYGVDVPVQVSGNFRIGDIRHNLADLTKVKSVLGYRPKVSFEEGIGKFVDWVKSEKLNPDTYDRSIAELREKGLYK